MSLAMQSRLLAPSAAMPPESLAVPSESPMTPWVSGVAPRSRRARPPIRNMYPRTPTTRSPWVGGEATEIAGET
eukprot:15454466-Alexandrium_andersonii.AAC.1